AQDRAGLARRPDDHFPVSRWFGCVARSLGDGCEARVRRVLRKFAAGRGSAYRGTNASCSYAKTARRAGRVDLGHARRHLDLPGRLRQLDCKSEWAERVSPTGQTVNRRGTALMSSAHRVEDISQESVPAFLPFLVPWP